MKVNYCITATGWFADRIEMYIYYILLYITQQLLIIIKKKKYNNYYINSE